MDDIAASLSALLGNSVNVQKDITFKYSEAGRVHLDALNCDEALRSFLADDRIQRSWILNLARVRGAMLVITNGPVVS